jgi:two-component system nitrogen regulation response regulator GlnG
MKKILLADDDVSVRQTLGEVLRSEQYDVVMAASGREAAAKFIADVPDLVLLDLGMPDRDGWDAFDLMVRTHPSVPVIMITALSGQYRRAAELGVDALMEKPLDLPLLLETAHKYLAESDLRHARRTVRPDFKTVLLNRRTRGVSPAAPADQSGV